MNDTTTRTRPTSIQDQLHTAPRSAVAAQVHGSPMLRVVRSMDRRGWMALGVIVAAGTVTGGVLGSGWSPGFGFRAGLMGIAAAWTVRAAWQWMRTPGRRARAGDSLRARAASFGKGAYGIVGLGFWLTFEAKSLMDSVQKAAGVEDLVRDSFLQWVWGFSADSILNAVWASIWPVYVLSKYGLVAAAVAYVTVNMMERVRERIWADEAPPAEPVIAGQ
ncbi:hypothetical protein [Longimicrobium terrae]|uniref:Uncharacterized protein n=1 Tax=Longimicrobium terrae TaxID=1639882 RepID=A0A841H5D0_9BACT|nr:hypothetical protein [Longimicrobium terrae]MBB4639112.1 hypothetical protein [Longimicrobium terrae]MBB6073287.1 hypothetical protein [Longimicrobium terrae]NNC28728.1 hypothetical protein [Longimicrobium terrae]